MNTTILTSERKKHLFHSMSQEFLSAPDSEGLIHLKNDLLRQVISCEFSAEMAGVADIIIPMWNKKLDEYILQVSKNEADGENRRSAEMALLGLSHLMDLSELARQIPMIKVCA